MSEANDFISLDTRLKQSLTSDQAWHYRIIPRKIDENSAEYYIDEQMTGDAAVEELEMLTGKTVAMHPRSSALIERTLQKHYLKNGREDRNSGKIVQGTDLNSKDFVLQLIQEAKNLGSSDIHIEIYEETCRVRLRIDGKLVERYIISKEEYPALINRVKIMSNLDIAEKRLPQDGRIFHKEGKVKIDIRVSVVPTLHGEKIVLRILSNDASNIHIHQLGFSEKDLKSYLESIRRPNGIILISGPTGSGKTTTLYATLKLLNQESRNILTVEDPIEYTLDGINQVQLKESIGLDFGKALRTFLRQDPDIIMVGEIRDVDTANMAVRAALTGHLVLSTVHTNSAWGTISRLVDMNIPSYLLAGTLNTSVAQRLLRKLCEHCKKEVDFSEDLYPASFKPFARIRSHFIASGCEHCFHTGYKGRVAIYEVIPIDAGLSEKIKRQEFDVSADLKERGVKSLAENAFTLFKNGETSLEEVYPLLFND